MSNRQHGIWGVIAITGAGQLIARTGCAPLERTQILLQCQNELLYTERIQTQYRGIIDCFLRTKQKEGFFSLWRGNLASCLPVLILHPLTFFFRVNLPSFLLPTANDDFKMRIAKNTLSGGLAGSGSLMLLYHLDYARTRLAADVLCDKNTRHFHGFIDVYRKTLISDGFLGLYRGFLISCIGFTVHRGIHIGMFETFSPYVRLSPQQRSHFPMVLLAFGSSVVATFLSYPFDTIRRRMMMRSCEKVKYKGSWDCFTQIWKFEGSRYLWGGALTCFLKTINGTLLMLSYEYLVLRFFHSSNGIVPPEK